MIIRVSRIASNIEKKKCVKNRSFLFLVSSNSSSSHSSCLNDRFFSLSLLLLLWPFFSSRQQWRVRVRSSTLTDEDTMRDKGNELPSISSLISILDKIVHFDSPRPADCCHQELNIQEKFHFVSIRFSPPFDACFLLRTDLTAGDIQLIRRKTYLSSLARAVTRLRVFSSPCPSLHGKMSLSPADLSTPRCLSQSYLLLLPH